MYMVMQNKTTAKKKMAQRRWSGRKIGFIAIGLVLLASLALWGIQTIRHNRAVVRERAQFMAAKADLHELAQQLAKEIGPPTASKEEQSCSYANIAYGKGALGCLLSLESTYISKISPQEMNLIIEKSLKVGLTFRADVLPSSEFEQRRNYSFIYRDFSCSAGYTIDNDNTDLAILCAKKSLDPYFQIK